MICINLIGEAGSGTIRGYEANKQMATKQEQNLAEDMMAKICTKSNLNRAYKRVKANKGAAGIDGMTVDELGGYLKTQKEVLIEQLMEGKYKPQPVKEVEIPKPNGGKRKLGIPTVLDRVIQQAIAQVMEPKFEKNFSEHSYGFRPKRNAHQALRVASEYVKLGAKYVVDIDMEKFFDRVNHDILMNIIAREIRDKRLLRLIGSYLRSGIMQDGICVRQTKGTPQGSPLSPLLSNIILDKLDKELEKRGHKFCRYADDCNIYVISQRAGRRVYKSIKQFLEEKLKLKVNDSKSGVDRVSNRKFLGYRIRLDGLLSISEESRKRLKKKIIKLTKRNRGISLELMIEEVNRLIRGWINYYKLGCAIERK